ncbi:MAG: hypothetical protein IJO10_10475 [Clostridia bacterium]|nr:hypothetical protein [Clostridia bacterium]
MVETPPEKRNSGSSGAKGLYHGNQVRRNRYRKKNNSLSKAVILDQGRPETTIYCGFMTQRCKTEQKHHEKNGKEKTVIFF